MSDDSLTYEELEELLYWYVDRLKEKDKEILILKDDKEHLGEFLKEIERLNKLINYKGLEDIPQYVSDLEVDNKQLKEENQLLNKNYNIINELEEWLRKRSEYTNFGVILDKIKELKGSDKE